MEFHKKLYTCDDLKKKKTKLKWELKFHLHKLDFYVIALANGNDMLEIFEAKLFQQKYFRMLPCYIVGFAGSYDSAIDLVQKILLECYETNHDYYIKKYLLK